MKRLTLLILSLFLTCPAWGKVEVTDPIANDQDELEFSLNKNLALPGVFGLVRERTSKIDFIDFELSNQDDTIIGFEITVTELPDDNEKDIFQVFAELGSNKQFPRFDFKIDKENNTNKTSIKLDDTELVNGEEFIVAFTFDQLLLQNFFTEQEIKDKFINSVDPDNTAAAAAPNNLAIDPTEAEFTINFNFAAKVGEDDEDDIDGASVAVTIDSIPPDKDPVLLASKIVADDAAVKVTLENPIEPNDDQTGDIAYLILAFILTTDIAAKTLKNADDSERTFDQDNDTLLVSDLTRAAKFNGNTVCFHAVEIVDQTEKDYVFDGKSNKIGTSPCSAAKQQFVNNSQYHVTVFVADRAGNIRAPNAAHHQVITAIELLGIFSKTRSCVSASITDASPWFFWGFLINGFFILLLRFRRIRHRLAFFLFTILLKPLIG